MAKFNAGDTVELNSGSPIMTVKRYDESGDVVCIWFVGGKNTVAVFPEATLKKSNTDSGESYVSGVPYE